jgi:LuxR family maltose regulon positive regulatory protein
MKNLAAEDSALTSYLVDEVLDAQPAAQRELMLRTSILDRVSADLAWELTGDEQASRTLAALARSGAFVQPLGQGWYRYHPLLAEVLRLKLRLESPDRTPGLHRQAASWYQRSGLLGKAVAHAAAIDDWQLAARIVVDELAVGELLKPRGSSPVADALRRIPAPGTRPDGPAQPPSLLAAAALELRDRRDREAGSLLAAAEELLGRLPADREVPSRLAAATLRLAVARRSGDLGAARTAAVQAETVFEQLPPSLRSCHPEAQGHVLSGRGAAEFWSGDPAAAAVAFAGAAAAVPGGSYDRAARDGHLALIEALRGRLGHAAELAGAGTNPPADSQVRPPASTAVALALVHLERNELDASRSRLKQAGAALRTYPDRLIGAVACLVAARGALARANGPAAAELIQRGRDGWTPPPWLNHLLTVAEAQASAAAGDIQAALDAARRAEAGSGLDAAVARARAFLAAGNLRAARQALPVSVDALPAEAGDRLEAYLTDALISFRGHDPARGRRSLERALRLGKPERRRLPFARDRAWIQPGLRSCPDLAGAYRELLQPGSARRGEIPFRPASSSGLDPVIVERLSDREREVLRFASSMLSTEEIAGSMYVSINTVKTHLKSIFRKLGATRRGEAVRRAKELGMI